MCVIFGMVSGVNATFQKTNGIKIILKKADGLLRCKEVGVYHCMAHLLGKGTPLNPWDLLPGKRASKRATRDSVLLECQSSSSHFIPLSFANVH